MSIVCGGVVTRLIGERFRAGVIESGSVSVPEDATLQGGVRSQRLIIIHLHEVMGNWFTQKIVPRLTVSAKLCDSQLVL